MSVWVPPAHRFARALIGLSIVAAVVAVVYVVAVGPLPQRVLTSAESFVADVVRVWTEAG
ncbi:hypothetical protein Val02_52080 [Virgisporangium aliadipatigenens]|uniref:Uncharacterized protein n=1 Tax=Virgisporangium aliadipatigenens TaxID=741659 RepID=A0A8J3YPY6_9ACTN|nr:hypothetical protein [Virgisporangium aliadipatigenens]GIJ48322.1 hypothetical protein Val02_52080 [Virgisporangium aliadipatigenens]